MTAELEKNRNKLAIPASGSVEIVIGPRQSWSGQAGVSAYFRCLSCDDVYSWNAKKFNFECCGCGNEVTADESAEVIKRHTKELKHLYKLVNRKRGMLWRLFRLFAGPRKTR